MKLIYRISFLFFAFSIAALSFADSPLTSTTFYKAYGEREIVSKALKAGGALTDSLLNYLLDENHPLDVKMAVINALGWDIKGKNNSEIFIRRLIQQQNYADRMDFLQNASGELLILMAYLKAMDNYFEVNEALQYAKKAVQQKTKNFTVGIIAALIEAQKHLLQENYCAVYNVVDRARKAPYLQQQMKPEAVGIIMEYINLYNENCTR
jgi:hypothetical protein